MATPKKLQATQPKRPVGRPPLPAIPVGGKAEQEKYSDPAEFMKAVMLGLVKASPTQLQAAKTLLQMQEQSAKAEPMGKKAQAKADAKAEQDQGDFAPMPAPIRLVR